MESTKERYWNELGYGRYYENYGVTEDEFNSVLLHELETDLLYKQDESELLAGSDRGTDGKLCERTRSII